MSERTARQWWARLLVPGGAGHLVRIGLPDSNRSWVDRPAIRVGQSVPATVATKGLTGIRSRDNRLEGVSACGLPHASPFAVSTFGANRNRRANVRRLAADLGKGCVIG